MNDCANLGRPQIPAPRAPRPVFVAAILLVLAASLPTACGGVALENESTRGDAGPDSRGAPGGYGGGGGGGTAGTSAGGSAGTPAIDAGSGCVDSTLPPCAAGCGSDWFPEVAECLGEEWVCPAGTINPADCPSGTCWGPPLPGEVCTQGGFECRPDLDDLLACPELLCATCDGFGGAVDTVDCHCECDDIGQVSCLPTTNAPCDLVGSPCQCFARPDCEALSDDCLCECDYDCPGELPCDCDCGGGNYLGCVAVQ